MNPVKKNRLILIAIALIFFVPLMAAMLMQSAWWNYQPDNTTNRGILLEPPLALALEAMSVQHDALHQPRQTPWTLLYPLDGSCAQDCVDAVTGLRQIHRAAGRHQQDLSIVLLSPEPLGATQAAALVELYPEFRLLSGQRERLTPLLQSALRAAGSDAQPYAGHGFIADPAGQLILAYPPPLRPTDINKDLKRLLKYSGDDPA